MFKFFQPNDKNKFLVIWVNNLKPEFKIGISLLGDAKKEILEKLKEAIEN